jgi:hypothetical protein
MPPVTIIATTLIMAAFTLVAWFVPGWHLTPDLKLFRAVVQAVYNIFVFKVLLAYWLGRNWARQLVLVASIMSFSNLDKKKTPVEITVVLAQCALAIFLLFYLNGKEARTHFGAVYQERSPKSSHFESLL